MTKTMLTRRLLFVALVVLALVGAAVASRLFGGAWGKEVYKIVVDFVELEIALIVVYLANVFQQRAFFVDSLRQLWSAIIEAKNELVQYTHDPETNQQKFGDAHSSIARAIDEMRGVYSNVGESQTEIGRYPYEPLHDMRKALDALGFGKLDEDSRNIARARVLRAWKALRFHFRNELNPPEPTSPITEQFARDPRVDLGNDPPALPNLDTDTSTSHG